MDIAGERRRYIRLWMEHEVEIVDETTTKAFLNDWGYDADGNVGMVVIGDDGWSSLMPPAVRAAMQIAVDALQQRGIEAGIRWMGGECCLRPSDGNNFVEITLPAITVRLDDGTYPDDGA